MTLAKICGLKDVKMALLAIENGADAIGFVFAPSKRQIKVDVAREIVAQLPTGIMVVGVFVNEEICLVNEIADEVGLTHIQLHGDEDENYIQQMNRPVWKAVSVKNENDVRTGDSMCEAYLFDSVSETSRGGTGEKFPWHYLKKYQSEIPMILAGGLHSENVKEAIETVKPWMVDVSSGVEENGVKNEQKIQQFLREVKGVRR